MIETVKLITSEGVEKFDTSKVVPNETEKSPFKSYPISEDLELLFRQMEEFVDDRVEIQPVLKPFQIDYVPAIGDVDPFIKVPRPDDV